MADKYIWHNNTYCGDGTTSAAATSNGGVGAWNNINVFEGMAPAYGSAPAAGDVVYIRSRDASGVEITRTFGASVTLGFANGVVGGNITTVLDQGEKWSGISGVLTYSATGSYSATVRNYNSLHTTLKKAWKFYPNTASSFGTAILFYGHGTFLSNLLLDGTAVPHGASLPIYLAPQNTNYMAPAYVYNPYFLLGPKIGGWYSGGGGGVIGASGGTLTAVNPVIEIPEALTQSAGYGLIGSKDPGGRVVIYGGKIFGVGATTGITVFKNSVGSIADVFGFEYPQAMNATIPHVASSVYYAESRVNGIGVDGLIGGGRLGSKYGSFDSRQDGYYPTLNAILPNTTSTPWSWKITPVPSSAWSNNIMFALDIPAGITYTEADAVKTVTCELLVATSLADANKATCWIDVTYTDSSGEKQFESTFNGGLSTAALDASSAAWTATTYGATSFNKRKISVTTQHAVKQNTMITAVLHVSASQSSAYDIMFFDPTPTLS